MTDDQCRDLLKALTAAWPKAEMPDMTARLYLRCLTDLPYYVGQAVVAQAVSTRTWMPTISELRAIAAQLYQQATGRPPADIAWAEVKRMVGKCGYYSVPEWSHPAIGKAMQSIGWRQFCLSEESQETIYRAQFTKVYEAQTEREVADVQMLPTVRGKLATLAGSMSAWRRQIDASPPVPQLEDAHQ